MKVCSSASLTLVFMIKTFEVNKPNYTFWISAVYNAPLLIGNKPFWSGDCGEFLQKKKVFSFYLL